MKIRATKAISLAMAATLAWTPTSCLKYRDVTVPARSKPESAEKKKTPKEIIRECQDNLINMDAALDRYRVTHYGRYPGSLSELVPDYINYIPSCPLNGAKYRFNPSAGTPRVVICPNGHRY